MSQHISSMLNVANHCPPPWSETVPSYNSHTLDEHYEPTSSQSSYHATSQSTAQEPRPPSSDNPYRQMDRPVVPPQPEPASSFSEAYQPTSQVQNQKLPDETLTGQPSNLPHQQTPDELAALQATSENANTLPDFLSLDRDLIFPPPPSQALYSLAYALSANGVSNTVRRSVPAVIRPDGTQRSEVSDKNLYTIRRVPLSNSTFSIEGKRRSTFPGTLTLKYHGNLLKGSYWECTVQKTGELLMRGKGEIWIDGLGRIVGREPGGICLRRKRRKTMEKEYEMRHRGQVVEWKPPVLELVGEGRGSAGVADGGEARIRDLLVTCWVIKCWHAERVASMVMPEPGDNGKFKRKTEATGVFF